MKVIQQMRFGKMQASGTDTDAGMHGRSGELVVNIQVA